MKEEKKVVEVTDYEQRVMVNGLMNFRNDLIAENKPIEDVNELIVRVIDAPPKKAKRNRDYEIR